MSAQLRLRLERPRSFRREDFILSEVNAEAVRALDRWPNWHAGALALIGPAGSGKSHLGLDWAARNDALVLGPDAAEQIASLAANPRPVLLEDVDQLAHGETLFHLINLAARPGGGLLLTARTLPATWPTDLPDLKSRLNALQTAELGPPDDEVLSGVLRTFFRERSIRASDELLAYLVRRIDRSIPEAQRMVERLDEAADLGGRPVNRALARQVLEIEPEDGELFDEL